MRQVYLIAYLVYLLRLVIGTVSFQLNPSLDHRGFWASHFHTAAMSSNRPSAADYSSLASPDTESLLSEDHLQEKPSLYSKSAKSSRNSRIKAYLHVGAVVFYSALTALLWIWSVKIKEKDCTCDSSLPYCEMKCYRLQVRM